MDRMIFRHGAFSETAAVGPPKAPGTPQALLDVTQFCEDIMSPAPYLEGGG